MIRQYAKTDDNGYVIGLKHAERVPGSKWFEVTSSDRSSLSINERLVHIGGGVLRAVGGSMIPEQTYDMERARQYPSVGDQLDAIWKAIAPLIENAEAEAILAKIRAVKEANPKT